MTHKLIKIADYLLVVSDEEIKEGDYVTGGNYLAVIKARPTPVSITQKKVIAHLPLNGSPILEGVPLLPPIEDDVEKIAEEIYPQPNPYQVGLSVGADMKKEAFINGYNKAKEEFMSELDKQILDFEHDYNRDLSQHKHFGGALFALNRLKFYLSQSPIETYGE